jgi:hypothetical protein
MSEVAGDTFEEYQRQVSRELHLDELGVNGWEVAQGPRGNGTMLLGLHGEDSCQAILLPGAEVNYPHAGSNGYSSEGWRWAMWSRDTYIENGFQGGRPAVLEPITFREAIMYIRNECPEQLTWLDGYVSNRWIRLFNAQQALLKHGQHTEARERQTQLSDMLIDASIELGADWVRGLTTASMQR